MTERPRTRSFDLEHPKSLDIEHARMLRRRLQFWRSVAGLLLLGVALAVLVFWNRRSAVRDRCYAALDHYGRLATAMKLDQARIETLVLQWQYLDPDKLTTPASHYRLVLPNWQQPVASDEALPLAVCSVPHGVITGEGRHVLFREGNRVVVRWVSEKTAAEIAEQARRSEQALLLVR